MVEMYKDGSESVGPVAFEDAGYGAFHDHLSPTGPGYAQFAAGEFDPSDRCG